MLRYSFEKRFRFFFNREDDHSVLPYTQWNEIRTKYLNECSILDELIQNGSGQISNDCVDVDPEEILKRSRIERQILGLPDDYPYEIYIESDGTLNQGTFKFKLAFYDFLPNGNRFHIARNGPILSLNGTKYLLSLNQFKVVESIEEFNSLPIESRTFRNNLSRFTEIKTMSAEAATLLDEYLMNENVVMPDKIKIEVNVFGGVVELKPSVEGVETNKFAQLFDRFDKAKDIYGVSGSDGARVRVVLNEAQQVELNKLKGNRRITDPQKIQDLVEAPEVIFDEDIIDLSHFGQRVREIGLYKPKFYPFVCPYKSQWVPGFIVKDKVEGEKRIHFKSEIELAEFEDIKNEAKRSGKSDFVFRYEPISVENAEKFISMAKSQLKNPKIPVVKEPQPADDRVLIIKENADSLEYFENITLPEHFSFKFEDIPNLTNNVKLKDHQINGIGWLQSLFSAQLRGCLLADDMGLGKTLQILYFIEWHAALKSDGKPYLIVAPVSLLENWENEYAKFFNPKSLKINVQYGKTSLSRSYSKEIVNSLQQKQIILTNYETLRTYQFNFCAVNYSIAVLDEAQKIKTPGTRITTVCKAIKADFKISLSGTPVENTLVDLWCIMDFSVPGLLGNARDFAKEYQNALSRDGVDIVQMGSQLRERIGAFLMRRLKVDVSKDLPEKKIFRIERKMPKEQFDRYALEWELLRNSEFKGVDGRNRMLKAIWAFRDISDHPFLVDRQITAFDSDRLISSSAKLQVLVEVLSEVMSRDEKVIIFADRRETQKMLQKVVFDVCGVYASVINGETPSSKRNEDSARLSRQQTIDRFQSKVGFNVIILSPLAAGVGLNITKANNVIHYSRHWNPAKEEQATDRAYRIGQERQVNVFFPLAVFPENIVDEEGKRLASFDENLDLLLERKKSLATSTLFPTEQSEVTPEEMVKGTFGGINIVKDQQPLLMQDLDSLTPNLFEASLAAMYSKLGYAVYLTPLSKDQGADVVVIGSDNSMLIQAKQSKSIIGNEAVQEIVAARGIYQPKFGNDFELVVISNSVFSPSSVESAIANKVKLLSREDLSILINKASITLFDVQRSESQRLSQL